MRPEKRLTIVAGQALPGGEPLSGYEIHLGETVGPDTARAWLTLDGRPAGAASADGRVRGCYLHGLFASDPFRRRFLAELGAAPSSLAWEESIEATIEALADHLARHVDLDRLLGLAGKV